MKKGLSTLVITGLILLYGVCMYFDTMGYDPMLCTILRLILLGIYGYITIRNKTLTGWILFSMFLGIEVGHLYPEIALHLKVVSKIFLQLIKTIIAPLIFATLVVGIAGHSNLKQVGRMGIKSLIYFEVVTTFALFIGLAAINFSQAGRGVLRPEHLPDETLTVVKQNAEEIILHVFPENIAKSIAEGQVLQIVVFSILFAMGLALVKRADRRKPMLEFAESLSEVMFKFTDIVMYFAPVAVFASIAYTVSTMGLDVLSVLLRLLLTLYGALIVFVLGIFLPIALLARIPIRQFIQAIAEPVSIAFATASSESALPKALENMEKFGVPAKVVGFVLPTGYSFNLDGTTLYLSLASVFVAQVAGIQMSFYEQLVMVLTLMLTSKGVAGVARASLVILLGTAAAFNLPIWPIYMILGIDVLMDMARTAVNVTGNCLASVVIAKWEGEFKPNPKAEY